MAHERVKDNDTGIRGINQNTKKINELVDAVNSLENQAERIDETVAGHESTIGGIITKIRQMWGRNALADLIDIERYLL